VNTPSLRAQARYLMRDFIASLADQERVQALYVLSSSADTPTNPTVFGDDSDFDLAVILDVPLRSDEWRPSPEDTYALLADRIPPWVPEFSFHVPVPWGSMEVNVHQLIYQYEADVRTVWNSDTCDAYANKGEVVFDHAGRFGELIAMKVREQQHLLQSHLLHLHNRITWDAREIAVKQARRVGPASGHVVLSLALDEVIDWIYVSHGRLIPNRKWKLHQLSTLHMVTDEQQQLIHEVLACSPQSMPDLERRINALARLCASLGIPVDPKSIRVTRKTYQVRKQLLGGNAVTWTSLPSPRQQRPDEPSALDRLPRSTPSRRA
jgi:hypothetical protein